MASSDFADEEPWVRQAFNYTKKIPTSDIDKMADDIISEQPLTKFEPRLFEINYIV